jgi:hypothetical protein
MLGGARSTNRHVSPRASGLSSGKEMTMKKKVRFAILMVAGVLAYFASEKPGMAYCEEGCWDIGGGITCCTNWRCQDYCY